MITSSNDAINYNPFKFHGLSAALYNIEHSQFRIDMDHRKWKDVQRILKHLCMVAPIANLKIWRNTEKRSHYHIEVLLSKPLFLFQIMALRTICYDDPNRILLDYIRLFDGNFQDFDWLATSKGVLSKDIIRGESEYAPKKTHEVEKIFRNTLSR